MVERREVRGRRPRRPLGAAHRSVRVGRLGAERRRARSAPTPGYGPARAQRRPTARRTGHGGRPIPARGRDHGQPAPPRDGGTTPARRRVPSPAGNDDPTVVAGSPAGDRLRPPYARPRRPGGGGGHRPKRPATGSAAAPSPRSRRRAVGRCPTLGRADGDLVGLGADLEPGTLLAAYRQGLFPMRVEQDGPLGWWSPDPRG